MELSAEKPMLLKGDCLELMKTLPAKSIDLFVLDLPYANKKFGNCTACAWDTPIDLKKMWEEIKRIMKPNATIVHFCNTKFGFALIESNPKWFRYDLIWRKTNKKVGFLNANKQPLRQHENIYIFKDKQGTYNPQKTEGKPYNKFRPTQNITTIDGAYGKIFKANKEQIINDRHPTSIINIENTILEYKNPHKTIHPTQKPVDLLEWLIKTYSNEKDTVMDFCMGSGTAGVACKNLNRKFIGIEKDKEIFEKAKNRINNS